MKIKIKISVALSLAILILIPQLVNSTDYWVSPRKGQDVKQQEKDQDKCYYLAKKQTNFDPKKENTSNDHVVHYAIIGAAVGAAVGSNIGTHELGGKLAMGGAIIGGGLGGLKKRNQVKEEQARRQQEQREKDPSYIRKRNKYSQKYISCLEAKGYNASEY